MRIETQTTVIWRKKASIGRQQLIDILNKQGINIPSDAEVFIRVPGGGGWSNCNLDLDESDIQIHWEERE